VAIIPTDKKDRLLYMIDLAWNIFFQRVCSGRTTVNKEASMQLHLSTILHGLGEMLCIMPEERFNIELESKYDKSNIDIVCSYGDVKAAIELKCFKKASNRAADIDMYDVFKDIYRLKKFEDFQVKKFICLTDSHYYSQGEHNGHMACVSIRHGLTYKSGENIKPSWIGCWKDKSRDKELLLEQDTVFNWVQQKNWYYINMNL